MNKDKFKDLENLIKYKYNNINFLKKALVHKSYNSNENNEKLEFLGDRVLGLIISKKLIQIYPDEKEGIIDKKFANLVNKKTCTEVASSLNLKPYMSLGDSYKGQKKSDEKIISDCIEALIGSIFLDSGLRNAEKFVLLFWKDFLNKSEFTIIDSKTKLQEYTLKKFKILPLYTVYNQSGPQHNPVFKVDVQIPNSKKYSATGNSKKKAQQNAANKLLKYLKIS